jgi:capsid protein
MAGTADNVKQALDNLDNQVVDMVGTFIKRRKKHYEEAALKLHQNLKNDVARYTEMAADRKITGEDLELLVKGRWAQLKIELLEEVSISKVKFEDVAVDVLKIALKTALLFI